MITEGAIVNPAERRFAPSPGVWRECVFRQGNQVDGPHKESLQYDALVADGGQLPAKHVKQETKRQIRTFA